MERNNLEGRCRMGEERLGGEGKMELYKSSSLTV